MAAPKPEGRYRRVQVRTWGDEKFGKLTPLLPSGQALWLYLLVGPHPGSIPGLFRAGRAGMSEDLGWEVEDFDKAFAEASGQGMVEADFKARVVWLPQAVKHNRPESPNVVRSWRAQIAELPECELKGRAMASLRASVEALGEAYAEAFAEACGLSPPKPSGKASGKASPNQEQEQEQEQEEDLKDGLVPGTGAAADGAGTAPRKGQGAKRVREITEQAMAAYNAALAKPHGLLPKATLANDDRLKAIRKVLPTASAICQQEFGTERVTPEFWEALFAAAADDPFHSGRQPGGEGHESWTPDFDFLVRGSVVTKLFERALSAAEAADAGQVPA